jgi:hypothetical protein
MNVLDLDVYVGCSRAVQSDELRSDEVARHPMDDVTIRMPGYMQRIRSHTIVYERGLARISANGPHSVHHDCCHR